MGKFENVISYRYKSILIGRILYSFTFEECAYFISRVEQENETLLFHYFCLNPGGRRKQFLSPKIREKIGISLVYDLNTGFFKYYLWKNVKNAAVTIEKEKI